MINQIAELPQINAHELLSKTATIEFRLTKGAIARIDATDIDLLVYKWSELIRGNNTYGRSSKQIKGKQRLLHCIILERVLGRDLKPHERVDHIDNNSLNNKRSNLRLATQSQNIANSRLNKTNTSGYKGVHCRKGNGRYEAKIRINYILKHLGTFATPEEAYEVYKAAAIAEWGEFAKV